MIRYEKNGRSSYRQKEKESQERNVRCRDRYQELRDPPEREFRTYYRHSGSLADRAAFRGAKSLCSDRPAALVVG